MSTQQVWCYATLQDGETRILRLHAGKPGEALFGSLVTVNLNLTPPAAYGSISYAWGSIQHDIQGRPILHHEIHISEHGKVLIPESLFSALQQFRNPKESRALWCDAVCIHQDNEVEKAAQVAMMSLIFGTASRVLVWLGPQQDHDVLAFMTIQACAEIWENSKENPTNVWDDCKTELDEWLGELKSIYEQRYGAFKSSTDTIAGLSAVGSLLKRNWFSRFWVVQEVSSEKSATVHPVQVCCGQLETKLQRLDDTVSVYLTKVIAREEKLGLDAGLIARIARQDSKGLFGSSGSFHTRVEAIPNSILTNIVSLSDRQCYDARDRVFAAYSFLRLDELNVPKPDYSVSAKETYRELVAACMTAPFKYDRYSGAAPWTWLALAGTESPEAGIVPRPSWVPHFHHFTARTRNKGRLYTSAYLKQFSSNPEMFACRRDPNDRNILSVKGQCFGHVIKTTSTTAWPQQNSSTLTQRTAQTISTVEEWYGKCRSAVKQAYPEKDRSDKDIDFHTMRFLTCGFRHRVPDELVPDKDKLVKEQFSGLWKGSGAAGFIEELFVDDNTFLTPTEADDIADTDRVLGHFTNFAGEADVGWLPPRTIPGDELCLVAGAPYPFVVRDLGNDSYKILGDAFTLKLTLKECLGGIDQGGGRADLFPRPTMSWSGDDEEVLQLFDDMDWITLQ